MNKKIILFLVLTFLITYGCWFTVSALQTGDKIDPALFPLYILGGFGPLISAFFVRRFFSERNEYKDFLKQIIKVKVNPIWYLYILIVPLIVTFLPWFINVIFTGKQSIEVIQPIYLFFAFIPVMIIGGGIEEFGWRGLLLPELLNKYSVMISTIVVAIFWTIWHIPLWYIKGVSQYGTNFIEFTISVIGLTFLFSIVYVKTRSIFIAVLFHSIVNSLMSTISTPCSDTTSQVISITVKFIVSLIIFIIFLISYKEEKILKKAA